MSKKKLLDDFFTPPRPSNSFNPCTFESQLKLVHPCWEKLVNEWYFGGCGRELNHVLVGQQSPRIGKPACVILPDQPLRALHSLALEKINVVIVGDEPSHIGNIADGLAFSSNLPARYSEVTRAIQTELANDLGVIDHGMSDLSFWSERGVLLLNCALTVKHGAPKSHAKIGWEQLTDSIVEFIANDPMPKAFLLWGKISQTKSALIEKSAIPHLIIKSDAPGAIASEKPFANSKPFSKTTEFLKQHNKTINWIRSNPATTFLAAHNEEQMKSRIEK
jgi:uracil-DNA glycosylase